MAAPTQAYPPWLSPVLVTATQDGVATLQTSIVEFPQTYYGPSIPLGSNWVYGGSTFPPSIATSFAEPTPASPSTSPSPTTLQTTPLTSSSVLSMITSTPTSSTSTPTSIFTSTPTSSSSFSTSSSPPSQSPVNRSSSLSSSTRLALILSVVLGLLLLITLLVVLFRIRQRLRRRAILGGHGGFSWSFINNSSTQQNAAAITGEGEDVNEDTSFLPSPDMEERAPGTSTLPSFTTRPPQRRGAGPAEVVHSRPGSHRSKTDSTLSSSAKREDIARFNSSFSTADAGSLFFTPGHGAAEGGPQRSSDEADHPSPGATTTVGLQSRGIASLPSGAAAPSISPHLSSPPASLTVLHMEAAPFHPPYRDEDVYGSDVQRLLALRARESLEEPFVQPPILDPDGRQSQPDSPRSRGSWVYPDSPVSETDERATLLTARRVNLYQTRSPPPKVSLEGWVTPPIEEEEKQPPSSWTTNIGGLAGFAKGLRRLSWFRRMDSGAGPSGTRHTSPSRRSRRSSSRPPSVTSLARPGSALRPPSGLLRPPFGSRPHSGVSFRSIEAELGLRPPGMRASATSGGTGSGSGKSGATIYHSASSRPRTPHHATSSERLSHRAQVQVQPTMITLPPDLDLDQGETTIRHVDVLDLPVPEGTLPLASSIRRDISSRPTNQDTASSRGIGTDEQLAFPPGLISVPKWEKDSNSGSSHREARDALEDEPPQAGGEWSSLRSKGSTNNGKGGESSVRRGRPVTRSSTGGQQVLVVPAERAVSETASIASAPKHTSDQKILHSQRSLTAFGLTLTPPVSLHGSTPSDRASRSGEGSQSSRPSRGSHSQGVSHKSSNNELDDGDPPADQGVGYNRASLSAMGEEEVSSQNQPPRPLSTTQPMLERTEEVREPDDSDPSRPGTGTSRPMSDTHTTGTFVSGTGSTVQTTVASTTGSPGKR